jgi:hypothetical protein
MIALAGFSNRLAIATRRLFAGTNALLNQLDFSKHGLKDRVVLFHVKCFEFLVVLALIQQACSRYTKAEHVNIDLDEMFRLRFKRRVEMVAVHRLDLQDSGSPVYLDNPVTMEPLAKVW